jgi:hypothetical protein
VPVSGRSLAAMAASATALLVPLLGAAGCGGFDPPSGDDARSRRVDPFRFHNAAKRQYERRAAAGLAHVLYELSPGGVEASARRTAPWRPLVDRVARSSGADPELVEALVFLESAGHPEVIAGGRDPENATGLTQIVASTGTGLLGMRIDVAQSRRLTAGIARAERDARRARTERARGRAERQAARLRAQRRRADERFDPARALEATGRYLSRAQRSFRRQDLAFVSYHMGIGNLGNVIRDFAGDPGDPKDIVRDEDLSYAKLYFDSTPVRHTAAYRRLLSLGDDSPTYYWRLLASRDVMRLYRTNPGRLRQLDELQTAAPSAEQVLHPPGSTPVFATPRALEAALLAARVVSLPADPRGAFRIDPELGELAPQLGQKPSLYRTLAPEALAALTLLGAGAAAIAPRTPPVVVTGAARDRRYQELVSGERGGYSLHTTGFAFDIDRRYANRAQGEAVQFMLDRLEALNLVAWIRERRDVHVVAAGDFDRAVKASRPEGG